MTAPSIKSKSGTKSDGKYELSRARSFYMLNKSVASQSRSNAADAPVFPYTPYVKDDPSWKFYTYYQNDTLLSVDVDITDRIRQNYISKGNWKAYQKYKDDKYLRSYTRYVYTLNRKTGEELAFYMTIVPSAGFVQKHNRRIRGITYLKRDESFNGYILYHNLDGSFAGGWEYARGQITGQLMLEEYARLCVPQETYKRLVLGRLPADYQVSLKMDNLSRAETDMDEGWDIDGGELPEVVVTPGGGGGGSSGDYGGGFVPDWWPDGGYTDSGWGDYIPNNPGDGGGQPDNGGNNSGSGNNSGGNSNQGVIVIVPPLQDPPTIYDFHTRVITAALKNNVKTHIGISADGIPVILTFGYEKNPTANAFYSKGGIYVNRALFENNYTQADMESCVFHEYVHAPQTPAELDRRGHVATTSYYVFYSQEEIDKAIRDFQYALRMQNIPLSGDLTVVQQQVRQRIWNDFVAPYVNEDGTPKSYIVQSNKQYCKNEIEAYELQLKIYGDQMSEKYRQETEYNLNTYQNIYNQIKDR